jgi:predicted TIM-barrel fold metal-dependent hydrolase
MNNQHIYNCHCHLFTDKNLPNNYLGFGIVPLVRNHVVAKIGRFILRYINPLSNTDIGQRFAAFLEATYQHNQEENLKKLIGYYPEGTKFVILPMDMGLMKRRSLPFGEPKLGKIVESIDEQHNQLAELAATHKDVVIPFAHIDPRREDALDRLSQLVESKDFKGVKIYPPLGYPPTHSRLMEEIYPYMVKHNLPLIAHCSPGSVYTHEVKKAVAHQYAHPSNYRDVMTAFPELRICLAHFGGISEWKHYFEQSTNSENPTWVQVIIDLMREETYPNLYADISYTIFNVQENVPFLKVLLQDQRIRQHILFGSDFFMVENHKYSERRLSIDLRSALGEELFWQISNTNPITFLG